MSPDSLNRLRSLSLEDARALRDTEWEKREQAYHAAAISDLNETVRRYNGVAPYAVRRSYYEREKELEKAYWDGGEAILKGVRNRLKEGRSLDMAGVTDADDLGRQSGSTLTAQALGFWSSIKTFIYDLRGRRYT